MRKTFFRALSFVCALCIFCAVFSSCTVGTGRVCSVMFDDCFDTVCSLYIGCDEARFAELSSGFRTLLRELNGLYNAYGDYEKPNVKSINDSAGSPVAVDEKLMGLLRFSLDFSSASGGVVSPAAGALTSLWKDAQKTGVPPTDEEIAQAKAHIGDSLIVLDENAGTVTLTEPLARIDVGATAKGYAARLLSEYLDAQGCEDYMISLGGSITAKGVDRRTGSLWKVGVRNPDLSSEEYSVRSFSLAYESIATSGGYERCFDYNGVRYHHIIDVGTGKPSARTNIASASVIHDDPALCDALSTALYILTPEEGRALLDKTGGTALLIDDEGTASTIGSFPNAPKDPTSRRDVITVVLLGMALLCLVAWWVLDKKKQKDLSKHPEKAAKNEKTPAGIGRFKKRDLILLSSLALLAILLPLTLLFGSGGEKNYRVTVTQNGEEVFSCALDENAVYKAQTEEGCNVVVIENGKVYISDADCEGKDCVRVGAIDRDSGIRVIACLPHRLIVRIVEAAD